MDTPGSQYGNITSAMTTADSQASGRLKVDVGSKKKKKYDGKGAGTADRPSLLREFLKNLKEATSKNVVDPFRWKNLKKIPAKFKALKSGDLKALEDSYKE